ncbi:MAG: hypothetical protein IT342_17595 [Candidatus Melainabacteria bacterium]|nr:hypothetical protein [Candidatus Melainabacteria bacterium]
MKKFNVSLLSMAAIALVGTSILPAMAGEGCCEEKKQKAGAEDCCKEKAKAEAKAAGTAKTADAPKPAETEKTAK